MKKKAGYKEREELLGSPLLVGEQWDDQHTDTELCTLCLWVLWPQRPCFPLACQLREHCRPLHGISHEHHHHPDCTQDICCKLVWTHTESLSLTTKRFLFHDLLWRGRMWKRGNSRGSTCLMLVNKDHTLDVETNNVHLNSYLHLLQENSLAVQLAKSETTHLHYMLMYQSQDEC